MADTANSYSSIGLAGYAVGTIQMTPTVVKWAPRETDEAPSKDVKLDEVLRASWAPMGRMTHVRLFCKDGTSYRFDGFKKTDMEVRGSAGVVVMATRWGPGCWATRRAFVPGTTPTRSIHPRPPQHTPPHAHAHPRASVRTSRAARSISSRRL